MEDKWLVALERLGVSTVLLFSVGFMLWKKVFPLIHDEYVFLHELITRHEAREDANQKMFLQALDRQGERFESGMRAFNDGLKIIGEWQKELQKGTRH